MHIYIGNLASISSDNSLSPGRSQAVIRINAGIVLIAPLGTNLSDILIEIHPFSFKKYIWKNRLENGGYLISVSIWWIAEASDDHAKSFYAIHIMP